MSIQSLTDSLRSRVTGEHHGPLLSRGASSHASKANNDNETGAQVASLSFQVFALAACLFSNFWFGVWSEVLLMVHPEGETRPKIQAHTRIPLLHEVERLRSSCRGPPDCNCNSIMSTGDTEIQTKSIRTWGFLSSMKCKQQFRAACTRSQAALRNFQFKLEVIRAQIPSRRFEPVAFLDQDAWRVVWQSCTGGLSYLILQVAPIELIKWSVAAPQSIRVIRLLWRTKRNNERMFPVTC